MLATTSETTSGNHTPRSSHLGHLALLSAVATTGLSAGFMFLWNEVNIPGLKVVDDVTYIQTMNGVNSVIRNAPFGIAFFGAMVTMVVTMLFARRLRLGTRGFVGLALCLYLFALVVTFTVHVPMNRDLLELTDLTGLDTAEIRATYEGRWNSWHLPRAWAILISFLSLVAATASELRLFADQKA